LTECGRVKLSNSKATTITPCRWAVEFNKVCPLHDFGFASGAWVASQTTARLVLENSSDVDCEIKIESTSGSV